MYFLTYLIYSLNNYKKNFTTLNFKACIKCLNLIKIKIEFEAYINQKYLYIYILFIQHILISLLFF